MAHLRWFVSLLLLTALATGSLVWGDDSPTSPEPTPPADEKPVEDNPTEEKTTPPPLTKESVLAALNTSCSDCHDKGAFVVKRLSELASLTDHYDEWMSVRQRLADHSMPPKDGEPLEIDVRLRMVDWIHAAAREAALQKGEQAGPPQFRRLSRHEYSNTMRDLLDVHFDAGHSLPQDVAGGEGFNNAAETLTISPIHSEKYLAAAEEALAYAARDSRGRARLLAVKPGENVDEAKAARDNLRTLAERAFRRPVNNGELDGAGVLYKQAREDGMNHEDASFYAMRGVLVSAKFLFLSEDVPATPGESVPLTNHELAARLSYFLWATMPDEKLRRAADKGELSNPDELRRQTLRMIDDKGTHLNDSLVQFVGQWLGTDDWGRTKFPDKELHPRIEDHHVAPMRNQPVYLFESILKDNGSLIELIDSDWTFMNVELSGMYRLKKDKIKKDYAQHLVRVPLPEEYRYRSGLLGCGAVMAVTAHPKRSSPVLRGAWVLDKMLGIELPPPPPDVPPLDESNDVAKAHTVRQRLEQHREKQACAVCHDRIDPVGFALENFDELGRWRDRDGGGPIDAKATLPDGTNIEGLQGLKDHLLKNKDQFVRHLIEKMLGYALARGLTPSDQATIEKILERVKQSDYKAQELVLGIVNSEPFRNKRANP